MEAFPEAFDTTGVELLASSGRKGITLMDELGFLEKDAHAFQAAVFARLEQDVPVLGVLRDTHTAFLDAVRAHPRVKLMRVSLENRDDVPDMMLRLACNVRSI
jgi:nucleoside-triphosphatase THEP1